MENCDSQPTQVQQSRQGGDSECRAEEKESNLKSIPGNYPQESTLPYLPHYRDGDYYPVNSLTYCAYPPFPGIYPCSYFGVSYPIYPNIGNLSGSASSEIRSVENLSMNDESADADSTDSESSSMRIRENDSFQATFFKCFGKGELKNPKVETLMNDGPHRTFIYQYLPCIMEELRSSIEDELTFVLKTNGNRIDSSVKVETMHRKKDYYDTTAKMTCCLKALPKRSSHCFKKEAILLLPNDAVVSKDQDTLESLLQKGVLGIASVKYDDNEDIGFNNNFKSCKQRHGASIDVEYDVSTWERMGSFQVGQTVKMYWLVGLIPAQRMYKACDSRNIQHVPHELLSQICSRNITSWPNLDEESESVKPELNQKQNKILQRSLKIEKGFYFLQGPPGTGKSTTIVNLLDELTKDQNRSKILVCGPSNKSIIVLLAGFDSKFGDNYPIALNGTKNKTPEQYRKYDCDEVANELIKPFVDLQHQMENNGQINGQKKSLRDFSNLASIVMEDCRATLSTLMQRNKYDEFTRELSALDARLEESNFDILSSQFTTTNQLLDEVKSFVKMIRNMSKCIAEYYLASAKIVFSTLVASSRKFMVMNLKDVDALIIDEASQALIPESLIPITTFRPKFSIIVGDQQQQLPPTVSSNRNKNVGYEKSLFSLFVEDRKYPYLMLEEQYRMHPTICKFSAEEFYDGKLFTSEAILDRTHNIENIFPSTSVFIDVQGFESKTKSIENHDEARAVVAILKGLQRKEVDLSRVSIITFYSDQVKALKDKIERESELKRSGFQMSNVNTVDGFQGEENDIVIISFVRTCQSVGFLKDHRRLNVAMTRAKHLRIMVGNSKALGSSNSQHLNKLLENENYHGLKLTYDQAMEVLRKVV